MNTKDGKLKSRIIRGASLGMALALAALVSMACSLGSGGSGTGSPSYSKGLISAKGSVWVNGVEYDTGSASISVDGSSGTDADLKVGMAVEVKGSADSGTGKGKAERIRYSADLNGPVSAVSASTNQFTVFGQTVGVDVSTVWDGTSGLGGSSPLLVGDRVEVSGSADAVTHVLMASRVEKVVSSRPYEVKGVVSALAAGSFTLTPPGSAAPLTVDFSGSLDPAVANGTMVKVWFSSIAGTVITTTAASVKVEEALEPDEHMSSEVGGIVSLFVAGAPSTFTIDGVKVSADPSLLPPGFGDGVKAEVKGSYSGGVLVADRVRTEREPNAELEGKVSAISGALDSITVDGLVIAVDSRTLFRDENDSGGAVPDLHFDVSKLALNDTVVVSGYYSATGSPAFSAYKVERLAPSAQALLRGTASAVSASSLTMFGLSVDISAATFKDKNGVAVASGSAFAALVTADTTVVEVAGTYVPGTPGSLSATTARIGEAE